ncbi:MAG: apolipoprotein N-acyltransferase [Bryobacterales bacterium]|nr:apolipoprotein N-acyltransferase [Bryobacterales bacterium]
MNWGLAAASALLLILTFPRFDFHWLIAVALTPLLVAVAREPHPLKRFALGWLTGAGCLFGITEWIRFVVTFHGNLGDALGWVAFLLFCLAKGLYFGVFAFFARFLTGRWWSVPALAVLWVANDITFGRIGWQWITLGDAGVDMGLPMRLAPLTGVHGLSFVFMTMSAALAGVVLRRPRLELLWLTPLLLLGLLPELPEARQGTASAVLVQPNVDETATWTAEDVDAQQRRMVMLSMRGAFAAPGGRPDLIIWPETPAPFYYQQDPAFQQHVGSLARVARAPVMVGGVGRARSGAPLNSAFLVAPSGELISRYDKIHLVPFGEFVPWPFRFLDKIAGEVGDFEAGTNVVISPVDGHRIGAFICYESAFPALVRSFARGGAEVLANVSNDGYFGRSPSARGQHLMVVRMRAAENRRWILRSTNNGITAAVDPAGRVWESISEFQEATALVSFSYEPSQTFYTRYGDVFAWSCAGVILLLLIGLLALERPR